MRQASSGNCNGKVATCGRETAHSVSQLQRISRGAPCPVCTATMTTSTQTPFLLAARGFLDVRCNTATSHATLDTSCASTATSAQNARIASGKYWWCRPSVGSTRKRTQRFDASLPHRPERRAGTSSLMLPGNSRTRSALCTSRTTALRTSLRSPTIHLRWKGTLPLCCKPACVLSERRGQRGPLVAQHCVTYCCVRIVCVFCGVRASNDGARAVVWRSTWTER